MTKIQDRNIDIDIIERLNAPEKYVDAIDDAIRLIENLRERVAVLESIIAESVPRSALGMDDSGTVCRV